jgi:hypothetical protein
MTNPRDTKDNVKVDFVWGNVPMQPNDDRGENTLDPDLDNHIIVVAEYNGFPGYTPVPPFTDNVENGTVPNVVGSTESAANSALVAVGLVKGAVTSTPVGATTVNDAKVKTQSVAAGTVVNEGTAVALTLFAAPTVPDVLGDDETTAGAALVAAGLVKGTVTTSTDGATELNDETVKSTTPAAGVKADTGSAVALTLFDYVAPAAAFGPSNAWYIRTQTDYEEYYQTTIDLMSSVPNGALELVSPATNFKAVFSGGDFTGEYAIASINYSNMMNFYSINLDVAGDEVPLPGLQGTGYSGPTGAAGSTSVLTIVPV